MEQKIRQHLAQYDLDIRKSHYRFMDQKVTPDVLAFVADCLLNFPDSSTKEFTKNDIWHSEYFSNNVTYIYNKPAADNTAATHEYDKFTAQPLKTLAYARVLKEEQRGGTNYYSVHNKDLLEFISLNDRNAILFLREYMHKVLADSGFLPRVENYIERYHSGILVDSDFNDLKADFIKFMIGNTRIQGEVEVRRIFPKVFNILAYTSRVPGSRKGYITESPYHYSDLMYNSVNFRDVGKLKNVTRQERIVITNNIEEYSDYEMKKAMEAVKKRHAPNSEVRDSLAVGAATQVHHIFPKSSHPELKSTLENLILLTPQQHNTKAHPNNKTRIIDPIYQLTCLDSKSQSVQSSVQSKDGFYSLERLVNVINHGLTMSLGKEEGFDSLRFQLSKHQFRA